MPSDNIRTWGRENGFDVSDEGRLPTGLRAAFDTRDKIETADDADTEVITERPPTIAKASPADRIRGLAERAKRPPVKATRGAVKAKARVSVDKVVSGIWGAVGGFLETRSPAVGRTLSMQAPMVGMVLEDKVKNTIADKMLQPLARGAENSNLVMGLIGPPLLVQALTMRPDRAPQIIPMLRFAMRSWVQIAGDKVQQQAQEDKEFEEKYGSKIDEMIQFIVEPLFQQEQ